MSGEITQLLVAAAAGDKGALDDLYERTYDELRQIARRQLRRGAPAETLQTTALVHEAYLKLFEHAAVDLQDRAHFFALAARAMRQILVDHFRGKSSEKRGGSKPHFELREGEVPVERRGDLVLAIDQALGRLGQLDERLVRVVECLFFGGMTQAETATALSITDRTGRRDWRKARAFLARELS